MEKITVFDYIKQIDSKVEKHVFDPKKCPKYMLALHYSQSNGLIDIANEINKILFSLNNDKIVYDYFFSKIPKGKRFIRWAKKNKEEGNKEISDFAERNDISFREAKMLVKDN